MDHVETILPPLPGWRSHAMELLTADDMVHLTPAERLTRIGQLWDSLDQDQLPVTAAQQTELESLLASHNQDRKNSVSWPHLKAELDHRLP